MKPFYGKEIDPASEKQVIEKILSKYRCEPVSADLKKRIYNELSQAKETGLITIPFKIVFHEGTESFRPPCIEVILETKV